MVGVLFLYYSDVAPISKTHVEYLTVLIQKEIKLNRIIKMALSIFIKFPLNAAAAVV